MSRNFPSEKSYSPSLRICAQDMGKLSPITPEIIPVDVAVPGQPVADFGDLPFFLHRKIGKRAGSGRVGEITKQVRFAVR